MLIGHLPDVVGLHVAGLPSWSGNLAVLLAKATIILVAAVAITRQMHRASAGARHLVWLVTLGTLLFVPAASATIASPTPAVSWMRRAIEAGSFIGELGFALWAVIALVIAAALGWSALAVRHIVRRAPPLDDPAWQTPLLEVSDRLGLTTPPRL